MYVYTHTNTHTYTYIYSEKESTSHTDSPHVYTYTYTYIYGERIHFSRRLSPYLSVVILAWWRSTRWTSWGRRRLLRP